MCSAGNRRLVARVAVDGHVRCCLLAESGCLLHTSKAVLHQESCLILPSSVKGRQRRVQRSVKGRRTWARPRQWHRAPPWALGHQLRDEDPLTLRADRPHIKTHQSDRAQDLLTTSGAWVHLTVRSATPPTILALLHSKDMSCRWGTPCRQTHYIVGRRTRLPYTGPSAARAYLHSFACMRQWTCFNVCPS